MNLEPTHARRTPLAGRGLVAAEPTHIVQFYEDDDFLCATVADFLAEGIAAGQPIVVVATEVHRQGIARHLTAGGLQAGLWLDARETLATFMAGSLPDMDDFRISVGGLIETSRRSNPCAVVRVYGEMVDLLWKDGNIDGAVQLEALWNELARTHRFTLLCAYAMGNFTEESHAVGFADICRHHVQVVPTEEYTEADDQARLREISRLQRQAQVLKVEIARREALEHKLHDALAREQAARIEAQTAAWAKSEFLAVMSHELRTPLNAIGGYVQLVELGVHGPLTDGQRDALARVQRSQRHLLSLINQVLNLTRIEQGHLDYAIESVEVPPVLADICSIVEPLLLPKQLTCDVASEPVIVRADREKLQQILLNLLGNAIKFTPAGGRVRIDASASGQIEVRDTGVGIAAEHLEAIFAPFVQLTPGRDMRQEGAGLGLAISRNLARGMGGDLTVTSTVGAGTTFTLTLPLA